jgi:hypothetical protein
VTSVFLRALHAFGLVFFLVVGLAILAPMAMLLYDAATDRAKPHPTLPAPLTFVHSLGVNPADGLLYAASLRGFFRVVAPDRAERIAASYRESSGFIVVGPDQFLASGRPDVRDLVSEVEPLDTGLIESRNAGRDWRSVSLRGAASFSNLAALHDLVYGYERNEGVFMVASHEGRAWERRSNPAGLRDFAVSPADANRVVATTPDGLIESRDGGRTWQTQAAPGLLLVEWVTNDELWGVDGAGLVYSSADSGLTWQERGALPAEPRAFLAHSTGLYAAVHDHTIYISRDNAVSWQVYYREPTPEEALP